MTESRETRAVILAAGEGRRLRPHTESRPKCLVPLGGRPLLERQLIALEACGITETTICTGYRAEALETYGGERRHNPRYAETNMVASLMAARDRLDGSADVLIAYSDIVYEPRLVEALLACEDDFAVTVDRAWERLWSARLDDPLADAETLRIGPDGRLTELGRRPRSRDEIEAQYMGLILARAPFVARLVELWDGLDPSGDYEGRDRDNMYMTAFLQMLIDRGEAPRAVVIDGGWLEVDTVEDLALYERRAAQGRLDELCRLPGGSEPC